MAILTFGLVLLILRLVYFLCFRVVTASVKNSAGKAYIIAVTPSLY